MGAVLSAWLVEVAIQVYKGGSQNKVPPGLPVPSLFLADMVLFGALGFAAKESSQLKPIAGVPAWGFVVATLMNNPLAPGHLALKLTGGQKSNAPSPQEATTATTS